MDLDRIRYLELRADGHVVAKVLFHLINLISVGFHDRRQGHKVRPDPEFLIEENRKKWILTLEICTQSQQCQELVFLSETKKDVVRSDS